MPSLWRGPSLVLPRCPLRTPIQSHHHHRTCLPGDPHVYLPFTSLGPLRASTPPILRHRSKRRLPPYKWARSRSPPPSPRHAVWPVLYQWTRAKMPMVSRTARQQSMRSKPGHGPSRQRKWTLMHDDPRCSHLIDPYFLLQSWGKSMIPPLVILADYASGLSLSLPPPPSQLPRRRSETGRVYF